MESGDTQTPQPSGNEPLSGEDVRRATFPQALRGYDRQAVHDLLDRVADWMEEKGGAVASAAPGMREEFAKVGERTAGILTAAEDAARNLREEAAEYAERLRAEAEDETRKARLNGSQRMDEMIAEAEVKAQRIIDEAVARRRQLNLAISSLIDRREEVAADISRLAEELMGAVDALRDADPNPSGSAEEPSDEFPTEDESSAEHPVDETPSENLPLEEESSTERPVGDESSAELPVEEEPTQLHPGPDSEDTEIFEDDNPETRRRPTLLVDPDEED